MTNKKYGKPSIAVIENKKSFFNKNKHHLEEVKKINKILKRQPLRNGCKICGHKHGNTISVQDVEYLWCDNCGHFSGQYQDTDQYVESLYTDESGGNYSENYKNNYHSRVEQIYKPKANFLINFMDSKGVKDFSVLDLGCGAGHFVYSLDRLNIKASGKDVSEDLVNLGNQAIGYSALATMGMDDIYEHILNANTEVVSLIGVLEHIKEPLRALENFSNSSAEYLYLQVPLLSLSVLLEAANDDIFPRQLNKGHTHLFTKESLYWLLNKYDLKSEEEWWFGTDIVDLFRHLFVKITSKQDVNNKIFEELIIKNIDAMQLAIDKSERASDVHMIVGKNNGS
tara:strand:+ start:550 stop:1569 length:1020 start_codon:yes stop_codon:yes gene_type:complete